MAVHLSTAGLDPGDRTRLSFGRLKIVFYEDIKRKCRRDLLCFCSKLEGNVDTTFLKLYVDILFPCAKTIA